MAAIAKKLAPEEIGRISAWLAGQPVPRRGEAGGRIRGAAADGLRRRSRRERGRDAAMRRRLGLGIAGLAALGVLVALAGVVAWLNLLGEERLGPAPPRVAASAELLARGEALTRAGDCISCHTARGGAPYAGGRAIETPFGNVFASNLTPDPDTGLGRWSADEFWRALHHGRSKSGRLLYPAFPYPNYTRVSRADADAMFAYLQSLPAVAQPNREHSLAFPFGTQAALAVWRALYFRPAAHVDDPARSSRMEPRRLPGRGPGPLQRLPLGAQRARRDPRHARPARRPDPGAELVRAFAGVAARSERRRLAEARGRAAAQDRDRAAGLRHGTDERGGAQQHPAPERCRPGGDGGLPAGAAAADRERPAHRRRYRPRARAARRCTRTIASPATASAARACRRRIRRWPAAGR